MKQKSADSMGRKGSATVWMCGRGFGRLLTALALTALMAMSVTQVQPVQAVLAHPETLNPGFSIYLPLNGVSLTGFEVPVDTDKNQGRPTAEPTVAPTPVPTAQPTPQPTPSPVCVLNAHEQAIAGFMQAHPEQGRAQMVCDPILAQVARARAADMAHRAYFGHTNPDGVGPNHLVRTAGYDLPGWYGQSLDANNIESIAAGYSTPEAVWDAWMTSPGHRRHVLASEGGSAVGFYADQVAYGIGFYQLPESPYRWYWVVLSAPMPGN